MGWYFYLVQIFFYFDQTDNFNDEGQRLNWRSTFTSPPHTVTLTCVDKCAQMRVDLESSVDESEQQQQQPRWLNRIRQYVHLNRIIGLFQDHDSMVSGRAVLPTILLIDKANLSTRRRRRTAVYSGHGQIKLIVNKNWLRLAATRGG